MAAEATAAAQSLADESRRLVASVGQFKVGVADAAPVETRVRRRA